MLRRTAAAPTSTPPLPRSTVRRLKGKGGSSQSSIHCSAGFWEWIEDGGRRGAPAPPRVAALVATLTSRHHGPLRLRSRHLRVNKVGLQLPFALHVDDPATRAHVPEGGQDSARLLRDLRKNQRQRSHPRGERCPAPGLLSLHTWILPSTPVVSIRLATLTLLPQMSYWGFWAPITPAITGPWLIPDRKE